MKTSDITKPLQSMNPNSDRDFVNAVNIDDEKCFPKFLKSIEFKPFRHIKELKVKFTHPITVITGGNRIGKSTILIAIACSHYKFNKRNPSNGSLERFTWGSIMRFTQYDKQKEDWIYFLEYKQGTRTLPKKGQRKAATNKWNGVAKKESQIHDRQVLLIDLERIYPARNASVRLFNLAKQSSLADISSHKKREIFFYLSYVLEEDCEISRVVQHLDHDVFRFKNIYEYSSFNSASGEDVLSKIIIDIVEAEKNSLILIDEMEVGLHPKVQRRLADVIYHLAKTDEKQFILTTHSPTLINSFSDSSRVFIEKNTAGEFKAIPRISINAAFTKMDSASYPLLNLFCEDETSKKIIQRAVLDIQSKLKVMHFSELVNIIISGSASDAYENFIVEKRTYTYKKVKTGFCCVLDGDMIDKKAYDGNLKYPPEDYLFFMFPGFPPEKYLLKCYLDKNVNPNLKYHFGASNSHVLFKKMVEFSTATDLDNAFDLCWENLIESEEGKEQFEALKNFLLESCRRFSPDL